MAAAVGATVIGIRFLPLSEAISELRLWIDGLGPWGPAALAAVYAVATILFVPGALLTIAAGATFGLVVGTATVSVGSIVGASGAFLLARYAAREQIARVAASNPRFAAIDRAIGEGGWRIVALLRLSPLIPFNLQNYFYGLTSITFAEYFLTSWVAMLPGTFLYVYLGHVSGEALGASRHRSVAEWGMLGVGLAATVAVTMYVARSASRALSAEVDANNSTPKGRAE